MSVKVSAELRAHRPHREPVVAVIGIHIPFTGIEVQFPSVRRRVERPTPVVTVAATVVERTAIDVACGNRLSADLITRWNLFEAMMQHALFSVSLSRRRPTTFEFTLNHLSAVLIVYNNRWMSFCISSKNSITSIGVCSAIT